MGSRRWVLAALIASAGAFSSGAEHIMPGHKMTTPPTIDGVVDLGKEWAGVPSGTGFVLQSSRAPADVDTTFWIAYDAKFIYFAAKMADPNPKGIKANAYQTNVSLSGDDTMMIDLDPVGNYSDWNVFAMNPRGATKISLAGGRAAKREWTGEFVAKGRITAEGWEVEARIPWGIMRLPAPGPRTMRFNVYRNHAATDRFYDWSSYFGAPNEDTGKWVAVEVPAIATRRTLKMLPFGYLGAVEGDAAFMDGGVDLKTALTDQLDFVGSIKPDFRNIENEILSLDYSHYELIADESRPFFKEGAENLDLWNEGLQFNSQRIRDFDVGAKVYGRLNDKTALGILDVTTLGESNAFVGTMRHRPDADTSLGASFTSLERDGHSNNTGGLSLSKSLGKFYAYSGAVFSDDETKGTGHFARAGVSYMDGGLFLNGGYKEISREFRPLLGYAPEVDLRGGWVNAEYTRELSRGVLREWGGSISASNYRFYDGGHFSSDLQASVGCTLADRTSLWVTGKFDTYEGVDEHTYSVSLRRPDNDPYRYGAVGVAWGGVERHSYFTPTVGWAYRPWQPLQLTMRYQFMEMGHEERDLAILTASYDMGRDNRLSSRIVKQDEHWNAYVAYSRMGNRGTEYFLIFGDPNARSFRASLIFKVTVPIDIGL